jgi:hypothetical protein
MQTETPKLSLKTYLDFVELLRCYRGDHESNRIFALTHKISPTQPIHNLLLWAKENYLHAPSSKESEHYLKHLSMVTSFLALFAIISGFLVGLGLLSYSGEAPVNIIYFLFVAAFLPLLSILFALLSMVSRGRLFHLFSFWFPLHWIEKLLAFLPSRAKEVARDLPEALLKWMFLERLQRLSLLFSVGLLLALIALVVVKDIAFGWSSTLNVSTAEFHNLLQLIALPWREWIPSAIPSLELVEISHYFRLGEHLSSEMIHNADRLGAWWKFLAMSTLVYAVVLRFLFWLLVRYGYHKVLQREFLYLEGVDTILREFETPFVSTASPKEEQHLEIVPETDEQVSDDLSLGYHDILGWNLSSNEILLANDTKAVHGENLFSVGGGNSFDEDEAIAMKVSKSVLLYVKSWEPPTMDFIDFLEIIMENKQVETIEIYPLGTAGRYYESDQKDIAVWKRKIQGLKSKKVWVIDA